MAKQLLIYESAVPVTAARHFDYCVKPSDTFAFSAGINAVPLMAVEFPRAAAEYAIVFTADGEDVLPAVILGVTNAQNQFLSPDAKWKAEYIPAFIRRYPFVFSSRDGNTLTLCIDESYPGINRKGQGNALFGPDQKPTPYVDKVFEFLKEYQIQFERTRAFGKRIKELQILEPMQANVTSAQGEKSTLGGFLGVSREKLRKLSGEQLEKLAKTDELELLYLHLASLRNITDFRDRIVGSPTEVAPKEAPKEAAKETPKETVKEATKDAVKETPKKAK